MINFLSAPGGLAKNNYHAKAQRRKGFIIVVRFSFISQTFSAVLAAWREIFHAKAQRRKVFIAV